MVIEHKPREVEHFVVGDYVTLKDEQQAGIVYKIDEAKYDEKWPSLSRFKLRPVYGAFDAAKNRGNRTEQPESMVKVDAVRLGLEYLKFCEFAKNVAKHYGEEPPA